MIHFGMPEFYVQVAKRLRDCGLVVAEGWDRPSSTGYAYMLAARITGQRGAKALVSQDIDYASLGIPVIWPDGLGQLARHKRGLGVLGWLDVVLFTPILTVSMVLGGRDWLLRARMEINDNTKARLRFGSRILIDERDAKLLAALEKIYQQHRDEDVTVAVVFGAGHIAAVVRGLNSRYGYRGISGEWLSVIDF
ncbi:MAG: hypothetical protein JO296_03505 [Pseudonocardiales bacterium]|nr:hypothetical protein [Pseudonocardiales bacterium]